MKTIKIKGMSCQHCVGSVKEALEKVDAISTVEVNLEKGEASYEGDVDLQLVKDIITGIGFEAE